MMLDEPNDALGLWARIRRMNPAVEWPDSNEGMLAGLGAAWRGGATSAEGLRDFDTTPVLDVWSDVAGGAFHDRTIQLANRVDVVAERMHTIAQRAAYFAEEVGGAKTLLHSGVYDNLPAYATTYLLPDVIAEPLRDRFATILANDMNAQLTAAEERIRAGRPPLPPPEEDGRDVFDRLADVYRWADQASFDERLQNFLAPFGNDDPYERLAIANKQELIDRLMEEHPQLSRANAVAALRGGPEDMTVNAVGAGAAGPDIVFTDENGNVVEGRQVKATAGTYGTFNHALRDTVGQLDRTGQVWIQVPEGSEVANDPGRAVARYQGQPHVANNLEPYRGTQVIIVSESGTELGRYNLGER